MIEISVSAEAVWGAEDWQGLAERAIGSALSASPYATLGTSPSVIEVAVRLSDDDEVHALNRAYREKDKPTNVLSFPMFAPEEIAGLADSEVPEIILGDIILAHGTCLREAGERNITVKDHATHLIVHGTLHLLGYDHIGEEEAGAMETLEQKIMAALGLHDPYGAIED
jgi:probable rRNA maturation factor